MNVVNNPVHRISLIISNFEGVIEHDVQYLPSDSGKYLVTENGWNIVEGKTRVVHSFGAGQKRGKNVLVFKTHN